MSTVHLQVKRNGQQSEQTLTQHSVYHTRDEHVALKFENDKLTFSNATSSAEVVVVDISDKKNIKIAIDIDNFPRIRLPAAPKGTKAKNPSATQDAQEKPKKKRKAVDSVSSPATPATKKAKTTPKVVVVEDA